jgi:UDP-glucose 6-dehydrogenase
VIKSTIVPEFARELLEAYPDRFILISPEFLTETTARFDTDNPDRNIIGVPDIEDEAWMSKAEEIMKMLPKSKNNIFCTYEEASLIKYAGNCFFYVKNMFFNMLYELATAYKLDWELIRDAVASDPRIGDVHTHILHKKGRGAGGHCLPKDFVVFRKLYFKHVGTDDIDGCNILINNEAKNKKLLKKSKKDLDILGEVYGKS